MNNRLKFITTILSCLVIQFSFAQSYIRNESYQKSILQAEKYVDSLRTALNIPGLCVAVSVNNEIVWAEGMGYADLKKEKPVTLNTQFRIGSISKSLTSIALGVLIEKEVISVNDSISRIVPQFPKKEYEFTVKQLASHQSGVPHYGFQDMLGGNKHYDDVISSLEVFSKRKLLFEPGTDFQYSSYGYVLLSAVIQNASNRPFLEFMKDQVFSPINANNTEAEDFAGNLSLLYNSKGTKEIKRKDISYKWAGGGMVSTATDLVSIVDNMSKLLKSETISLLTTPIAMNNGTINPQNYGMGWRYYESGDLKIIHHGGTIDGGRAFIARFPDDKITVAVTTNCRANYGLQQVYDISRYFKEN